MRYGPIWKKTIVVYPQESFFASRVSSSAHACSKRNKSCWSQNTHDSIFPVILILPPSGNQLSGTAEHSLLYVLNEKAGKKQGKMLEIF